MTQTLFEKIINREIPAKIIFEDEQCLAFEDINPQAPTHVLLIPKNPIKMLNELTPEHADLMGHLMTRIPEITQNLGISDNFRLVINNGPKAGQTVYHIHIHILSGRIFSWPPG